MSQEKQSGGDCDNAEALVARLRRAFALGEDFSFYLVGCSREQAQSVIERAAQNSPWRHEQLDPCCSRDGAVQLDRERRRAVLERLHRVDNCGDAAVLWLNATGARGDDDDSWRELFRRMNEQRNSIARARGAPLVVVGRSWLCRAFAIEAPDFWSIRTFSARLDDDER